MYKLHCVDNLTPNPAESKNYLHNNLIHIVHIISQNICKSAKIDQKELTILENCNKFQQLKSIILFICYYNIIINIIIITIAVRNEI